MHKAMTIFSIGLSLVIASTGLAKHKVDQKNNLIYFHKTAGQQLNTALTGKLENNKSLAVVMINNNKKAASKMLAANKTPIKNKATAVKASPIPLAKNLSEANSKISEQIKNQQKNYKQEATNLNRSHKNNDKKLAALLNTDQSGLLEIKDKS